MSEEKFLFVALKKGTEEVVESKICKQKKAFELADDKKNDFDVRIKRQNQEKERFVRPIDNHRFNSSDGSLKRR